VAFDNTLGAARSGEAWALAELYRQFHPSVLGYLRLWQPTEAEDLAADVFVAVAERICRFEGKQAAFRSWVFAIAYRRLMDHRRRLGRRRSEATPADRLTELAVGGDAECDALVEIGTGSALSRIAALPPAQAEVLLLRIVCDLSVDHVAGIVGRRPGTVRVLQHRALRRLANDLAMEPVSS
jgi:RNA polymerase sigma-70 factor (ECF subfamily)